MAIPHSKYKPLPECLTLLEEAPELSAEVDWFLDKYLGDKEGLKAQETLANSYSLLLHNLDLLQH